LGEKKESLGAVRNLRASPERNQRLGFKKGKRREKERTEGGIVAAVCEGSHGENPKALNLGADRGRRKKPSKVAH